MHKAEARSRHTGFARMHPTRLAGATTLANAAADRRLLLAIALAATTTAGLVAFRSFAQGEMNPPQYAHGDAAATPLDHIAMVNQSVLPATFHLRAEFADGTSKTGTGFVVEGDGKAFTYAPLVHGASRVRVRMSDGTWLKADVDFADLSTGVAGIMVHAAAGTTVLTVGLGHNEETAMGENVATLGLPAGVLPVMSVGRLAGSGIVMQERSRRTAFALTDALITPATAGGPVVAADGRVIGIASDGDGIFVPISTAHRLLGVWRDRGRMTYSTIGATLAPVRNFTTGERAEGDFGCVLAKVEPRTPADDAGLLTGDRLLEIDGIPINVLEDEFMPPIQLMVDLFPADKPLKVMVRRDGKIINTEIVPMAESDSK